MLKRFILTATLTCAFVIGVHPAHALTLDNGLTQAGGEATFDTTRSAADVVGLLIKAFVGILGVVFLLLTLYAGFTWMTAAGDPKKVDRAKGTLASAVIGLVICMLAYTITSFIVGQIQYTQEGITSIPQ